jgi:hypothetical protein
LRVTDRKGGISDGECCTEIGQCPEIGQVSCPLFVIPGLPVR